MSDSHGSVSQWIQEIKDGSEAAAAKLWDRYYGRLVALAYQKLRTQPRRVVDEEDVVLEAFHSFCQRARAQKFPDLRDRHDFWHLIVRITEQKAYDHLRAQRCQKRGAGKVGGESTLRKANGGLHELASPVPSPDFAAEATEAVQQLFNQLENEELRRIAQRKLEGYTNEEIAAQIGRSLPTVERRLRLIREIWKKEIGDD